MVANNNTNKTTDEEDDVSFTREQADNIRNPNILPRPLLTNDEILESLSKLKLKLPFTVTLFTNIKSLKDGKIETQDFKKLFEEAKTATSKRVQLNSERQGQNNSQLGGSKEYVISNHSSLKTDVVFVPQASSNLSVQEKQNNSAQSLSVPLPLSIPFSPFDAKKKGDKAPSPKDSPRPPSRGLSSTNMKRDNKRSADSHSSSGASSFFLPPPLDAARVSENQSLESSSSRSSELKKENKEVVDFSDLRNGTDFPTEESPTENTPLSSSRSSMSQSSTKAAIPAVTPRTTEKSSGRSSGSDAYSIPSPKSEGSSKNVIPPKDIPPPKKLNVGPKNPKPEHEHSSSSKHELEHEYSSSSSSPHSFSSTKEVKVSPMETETRRCSIWCCR